MLLYVEALRRWSHVSEESGSFIWRRRRGGPLPPVDGIEESGLVEGLGLYLSGNAGNGRCESETAPMNRDRMIGWVN